MHTPSDVVLVETRELSQRDREAIRRLLDAAFDGDFADEDWAHALGGWHAVLRSGDHILAHASVVPRGLTLGEHRVQVGYIEAVGVLPAAQGRGLGTLVMDRLGKLVRSHYELGVLSSGAWHFYERLGWERWSGPTFVRHADGMMERTPEEDDGIMILRGPRADIDLASAICCDARTGDSW